MWHRTGQRGQCGWVRSYWSDVFRIYLGISRGLCQDFVFLLRAKAPSDVVQKVCTPKTSHVRGCWLVVFERCIQ